MKIFVAQFYVEVGCDYSLSNHFHHRISDELTRRVVPSAAFVNKYAEDFKLMFRMSAKSGLVEPEVRGPMVFKKDKDVEYSIFLPFDLDRPLGPSVYRHALKQLLGQIIIVLTSLQMDVSQLSQSVDEIIERIVADPKMFQFN